MSALTIGSLRSAISSLSSEDLGAKTPLTKAKKSKHKTANDLRLYPEKPKVNKPLNDELVYFGGGSAKTWASYSGPTSFSSTTSVSTEPVDPRYTYEQEMRNIEETRKRSLEDLRSKAVEFTASEIGMAVLQIDERYKRARDDAKHRFEHGIRRVYTPFEVTGKGA